MADTTVDVTKAPAKILSVTELKNGQVFVITEAKVYNFMEGKLRPVIFADVEHEAVMNKAKPAPVGAVPASPPPPAPVTPPAPPVAPVAVAKPAFQSANP